MPFAVTGSHSHLSVCPPLGLVQSWPEPAGVAVTGQTWKNGKNVWVLAVTPSPSDQGAAAGPSWSQPVPGPGPSLWLSDWDSGRLRPHVQTGVKIPVPPAPPGGREGLGTTAGLTAHPHRVQSLGKGSGQGVDGVRGSYAGGADLPAPTEPGPGCLVWRSPC